jgi:hypothetical protein
MKKSWLFLGHDNLNFIQLMQNVLQVFIMHAYLKSKPAGRADTIRSISRLQNR